MKSWSMSLGQLSEIESDALTEVVNVAVSGAAVRLRAMVGAEIVLSVPVVDVLAVTGAAEAMRQLGLERFAAVSQVFDGEITGRTMLLFPDDHGDQLARAIIGDKVEEDEIADLVADTLGEVGNVLLLGFLSTIGAMLGMTFKVGLPKVETASAEDLFDPKGEQVILFVYINFNIRNREVRGYFSMILGLGSFVQLQQVLAAFLQDLMDPTPG